MDDTVKSLDHRFPHVLSETGESGYTDLGNQYVGYSSISDNVALGPLGIPDPEFGVLLNLFAGNPSQTDVSNQMHWVQKYYGTDTGSEWTRRRRQKGNTYEWGDWEKVAKLTDSAYSVLVMENGHNYQDIFDDTKDLRLPLMVYQDPTANLEMVVAEDIEGIGKFKVGVSGKYKLSCIIQLTGDFQDAHAMRTTDIIISLMEDPSVPLTRLQTTGESAYDVDSKMFFPLRGDFPEVHLESGKTYHITLALTKTSSSQERPAIQFDSFKNLVSIDPARSKTKTGKAIMETIHNTMAGLSNAPGTEVRTEKVGASVTVAGKEYSRQFKTLTTPQLEVQDA